MRTVKNILLVFSLIITIGCSNQHNQEILKGDLYFSFFRYNSFYNQPDSIIEQMQNYFDTLDYNKASQGDQKTFELYQILNDNQLINKPYVDILVHPDSIVKLYLDITDYELIKIFKHQDLQNNNKKVEIKAFVTNYSNSIFYCDSLIHVKKMNGRTLQIQKKFRIEDYN